MRERWEAWRNARVIRRVRREMAFFGYPLDDLTDEQLESGIRELGRIAARTGISAREFQEQVSEVREIVNVDLWSVTMTPDGRGIAFTERPADDETATPEA